MIGWGNLKKVVLGHRNVPWPNVDLHVNQTGGRPFTAAHPEVFMPPYEEVHFFDRYYSKGSDWYRTCFAGRPERLVGEATPAYLYFEGVPELVRRQVPDAKIIAIQ